MIEIKPISRITLEELEDLGEYGYVSNYAYKAKREEKQESVKFELTLEKLEKPFRKKYVIEVETCNPIMKKGYSLAAYDKEKLVGIIIVEPQEWNKTLSIMDIHVKENLRKKGIGQRLIRQVLVTTAGDRYRAILAETQATNVAAIQFYRRCGFTMEGLDLSLYSNSDIASGEVAVFFRKTIK